MEPWRSISGSFGYRHGIKKKKKNPFITNQNLAIETHCQKITNSKEHFKKSDSLLRENSRWKNLQPQISANNKIENKLKATVSRFQQLGTNSAGG